MIDKIGHMLEIFGVPPHLLLRFSCSAVNTYNKKKPQRLNEKKTSKGKNLNVSSSNVHDLFWGGSCQQKLHSRRLIIFLI